MAGPGPVRERLLPLPVDAVLRAAADRHGLVVAGGLAGRNGFDVRLGRSPSGGVIAAVRVPATLLAPPAAVPARRR